MKCSSGPACAIAILFLVGGFWSTGHAASAKEEYELQERCGKRAIEVFEKLGYHLNGSPINVENGQQISSFQNHYSKRLNKCFMLLTNTIITTVQKKTTTYTEIGLFDVNEQRDYKMFATSSENADPFQCDVAGKHCGSKDEWEALVKPYLEDVE